MKPPGGSFQQEALMKKVLYLFMAVLMICALAGCNTAPNTVAPYVTDSTYNGPSTGPIVSNGLYGPNGTYGNNMGRGTNGNNVNRGTYGNNVNRGTYGNNVNGGMYGNNVNGGTYGNNVNRGTYGNNVIGGTAYGNNVNGNTYRPRITAGTHGSASNHNGAKRQQSHKQNEQTHESKKLCQYQPR